MDDGAEEDLYLRRGQRLGHEQELFFFNDWCWPRPGRSLDDDFFERFDWDEFRLGRLGPFHALLDWLVFLSFDLEGGQGP